MTTTKRTAARAAATPTVADDSVTLKGVWKLLLKLLGVTMNTAEKVVIMADNLTDAGVSLTGMARDAAEDLRIKSALEAEADFTSDLERINEKRKTKGLAPKAVESKANRVIKDHL